MSYYNENHSRRMCRSVHINCSNRSGRDFSNLNYGNYRCIYTNFLLSWYNCSLFILLSVINWNGPCKFELHLVLCFWIPYDNDYHSNFGSFIRIPLWNPQIFLTSSFKNESPSINSLAIQTLICWRSSQWKNTWFELSIIKIKKIKTK